MPGPTTATPLEPTTTTTTTTTGPIPPIMTGPTSTNTSGVPPTTATPTTTTTGPCNELRYEYDCGQDFAIVSDKHCPSDPGHKTLQEALDACPPETTYVPTTTTTTPDPVYQRWFCVDSGCVLIGTTNPLAGAATKAECCTTCEACNETPPDEGPAVDAAFCVSGSYTGEYQTMLGTYGNQGGIVNGEPIFTDGVYGELFFNGTRWALAEVALGPPVWVSSTPGLDGYLGTYYNVATENPADNVTVAAGLCEDTSPEECILAGTIIIEDLGEGNYQAKAVVTGATGATLTFLKDGAPLTLGGDGISAPFTLAQGASATIVATAAKQGCTSWGDSARIQNSDEPGGDGGGDDCCEPGFYREVEGGPCLPIPTGSSTPPAVPPVPTATKNCATSELTVASPTFPTGAQRIEIQREGDSGVAHTFTAAGSWADESAGLASRRYRARACNDAGCSAWSDWSAPVSLASAVVPAWVSPAENSSATGVIALVASAGARAGLFGTDPVSMTLWGGALPVTYDEDTNQWKTTLDTRLQYQGEVEIVLQARDVAGCTSLPVTLHLNLDNSLERRTRWSEKALDAAVVAEMEERGEVITHTGYYAKILQGSVPDVQRFFRWYVVSPDPGAATPGNLNDDAFMKNRVKGWQSAAFNDVTRLVTPAVAGATAPDHTARLAMEAVPCEALSLYDLGAAHVIKIRQTAPDEIEVLTSQQWLKFTADGLETVCTFEDFNITGAITDGARLGSKIYLSRPNSRRIVAIDTTTGKVTGTLYPWDETRYCVALEAWKGAIVAIYSDATTATGYTLEGGTFDDPFTVDAKVTRAWVREGELYLATSQNKLLKIAEGSALTTVLQHNQPVSAFQVFASGTAQTPEIGDESGKAYRVDANADLLASGLGGVVADLGRFKGAGVTPRGALILSSGANVGRLFLAREGVYEPRWDLQDLQGNPATKAVALARLLVTIREPSGNPLMGGDAGLFSESLLVAFETASGAYLARIQEADVDLAKVKKGRAVVRQNFKRARAVKAPTGA